MQGPIAVHNWELDELEFNWFDDPDESATLPLTTWVRPNHWVRLRFQQQNMDDADDQDGHPDGVEPAR